MYTNLDKFGGNFRVVLDSEFSSAQNVTIASGYTSLDLIQAYQSKFVDIAKKGGQARLLIGMAFYEGLSQKKLDAATELNEKLMHFGNGSGVYVTNGRKYHGKVYYFSNEDNVSIYVGSSNFSSSGTKGNIECTVPIFDTDQKLSVVNFIQELYSRNNSITINKAEITVPGKKKIIQNNVEAKWNRIKRHQLGNIVTEGLSRFIFPLNRIAEKEKSNLNVYFGKGRWSRSSGKITPRPWYEIELIADRHLSSSQYYPKGDFLAYTDDGYILPMRTQGDYFKNIRSKESLQLFGIWLKGKLESRGVLKKYEPVTKETLEEYGNNKLTFYMLDEGEYYLIF